MKPKLTVVARFEAKEGSESVVEKALLELVEPTRKEEGCLLYDLHRSEDGRSFLFYEHWTGADALTAHFATPYISGLRAKLEGHLVGEVELTKWSVL